MKRASVVTMMGLGLGLTSAFGAGCSGEGAACGVFAACGGDVTGAWTIATACYAGDLGSSNESCPTATYDTSGVSVSGSFTFGADKSYSRNTTFSGSASVTLPGSCLTMGGVTLTCEQLSASLSGLLTGEKDSPFEKASCAGSGSCTCTMTYRPMTQTDTGTYITSGNAITLTSGAGMGGEKTDYCVKGNELAYASESATDMGPMGTMTMRSYLIARK